MHYQFTSSLTSEDCNLSTFILKVLFHSSLVQPRCQCHKSRPNFIVTWMHAASAIHSRHVHIPQSDTSSQRQKAGHNVYCTYGTSYNGATGQRYSRTAIGTVTRDAIVVMDQTLQLQPFVTLPACQRSRVHGDLSAFFALKLMIGDVLKACPMPGRIDLQRLQ